MDRFLNNIKNNKIAFVSSIIFVIALFVVFLGRGTHSILNVDEGMNGLYLDCPSTALSGELIECSLNINVVDMTIYGINAKYELTDGLVVGDFISSSWEVYLNDESGFVLVNLGGVDGSSTIGTVRFTIPSEAKPNEKFKLELTDISVGDGEDTVLNFDNVSDEVRIKSDINTLDSININNVILNETFDKEVLEYTGVTSADKINISVVKTDDNSVVSGDIGEKDIHYGTNKFSIVVTSETGNVRTYILMIYKEYKFSSDKYVYNEKNNYLYVASVKDNDIILNNIDIPEELNKKIDDNKLVISYEEEVLKEISVVSISSEIYDLSKEYIYIKTGSFDISKINYINCDDELVDNKLQFKYKENVIEKYDIISLDFGSLYVDDSNITLDKYLTYDEFVNNIIKNGNISYKVINAGEVVTSGNITNNMILELYYGDEKIDSYNIVVYNLSFNNDLIVDEDDNYIKYNKVEISVNELLSNVSVVGDVRMFISDMNGNEKNKDDIVVTGDTFTVYLGSVKKDEYKIAIRGDANGDGKVSLTDLVQLRKHIVSWKNPETGLVENKIGVYFYALDMNDDGKITLTDLVKVRKVLVGIDIDE